MKNKELTETRATEVKSRSGGAVRVQQYRKCGKRKQK